MRFFRVGIFTYGFFILPWLVFAQEQTTEGFQGQGMALTSPDNESSSAGVVAEEPDQDAESRMGKMKRHHEKMMRKMIDSENRLDEKLTAMNEAAGAAKIEAVAAVLNELISQQKSMHKKMMSMHGKMCKMIDKMGSRKMQKSSVELSEEAGKPVVEVRSTQPGEGKEGKSIIVVIQE